MPIARAHTFTEPTPEGQADLSRRALAAWFGSAGPMAGVTSGYVTLDGLGYVTVRQAGKVLAVYRVRSDNLALRLMRRPPKGLEK